MAKHANPTLVGGFVVGAVVLLVGGLTAFGSGSLFGDDDRFIAFFESSVEGLDVGAPVKYRGVQVGSVTRIRTTWDPGAETIRIPVELGFSGTLENVDAFEGLEPDEVMEELIDLGLRAQLRMGSFVTGKLHIELDFRPDSPESYVGGTELPEIPTIASPLDKLMQSIEDLPFDDIAATVQEVLQAVHDVLTDSEMKQLVGNVSQLSQDLSALSGSARTTLEDVNGVVRRSDTRLSTLLENADGAVSELRMVLAKIDGQVEPVSASAQETMADLRGVLSGVDESIEPVTASLEATMTDVRALVGRLETAAGGDYTLVLELQTLLREMREAARSLTALADYLQQRPEALISGKK